MRFMGGVERIGNKLPHPFYLFALLAILAVVLSVIFNGASVTYEVASSSGDAATTATATVKNLLNRDTIGYVITSLYKIYFNFSPMMMIGLLTLTIGLCEQVGLFDAVIRKTILGAKPALIFAIVSFIAFQSNMASSAGILGCTTVAASLFASLGYNPWLGIILAYAAGNAGMFANVFPGQMDVLLVGVTQSVCASLGLDGTSAHVLMNWFFMLPCAVVLTVVYTLITTKFTSRFMGPPKDLSLIKIEPQEKAENTNESRALRKTAIATVLFFVVLIVACIPKNSFLRSADGTLFPASPLMSGILTLMSLAGRNTSAKMTSVLVILGLIGGSFFYGEVVITPAISVMSAIEGLEIIAPQLDTWIVPISIIVLTLLFAIQKHGTGMVGKLFAPIMLIWFLLLAVLGARSILDNPGSSAGAEPLLGGTFLPAVQNGILYCAWRGGAVDYRCGSAVCRYGSLRQTTDSRGVVLGGAAITGA